VKSKHLKKIYTLNDPTTTKEPEAILSALQVYQIQALQAYQIQTGTNTLVKS